jgi:DNA-binding protein
MIRSNKVLIGNKPVMNYVVASLTIFNQGENTITLRARGRAISTAVDVVEMLRRVFIKDINVESINIGSEDVLNRENEKFSISVLEIKLTKILNKENIN